MQVAAGKDGILKLQNRALNIELSKKKREIERLRRELDDAVAKERIKEAEFVAANTVLAEVLCGAVVNSIDPALTLRLLYSWTIV